MRRILAFVLTLVLLTGCTAAPVQTTAPTEPTTVPTEPTTEPTTAPTEDPADSIRTGYYLLTGFAQDGESIDGIAMAAFRGYLEILPDRTGLLSMNGVIEHVDWTGTYLTIDGVTCKFTIEDDVMTLNYKYEWEGTFTYCADELPDYYRNPSLEAGLYLLTDMVIDGEAYYIENPDMTYGYFLLKEDHTGIYYPGEGEELSLTWRNDTIIIQSFPLTYQFFPADQTEDGIATLALYDLSYCDVMIFRAVKSNSSDDF